VERAKKDKRRQAASTQAGEFVREESTRSRRQACAANKQAIADRLSKARRAGVKLPAKKELRSRPRSRRRDLSKGQALRRKSPPNVHAHFARSSVKVTAGIQKSVIDQARVRPANVSTRVRAQPKERPRREKCLSGRPDDTEAKVQGRRFRGNLITPKNANTKLAPDDGRESVCV